MNDNNDNSKKSSHALPLNTYDSVPQPKSNAKTIVSLVKESGSVTGYKLSDGNIVSREQGVSMAQNGEISGVGIAHKKDTVYLKSLPDDNDGNNLGSLPTVTD